MPTPAEPTDSQRRTFAEYVADQIMGVIAARGMTVRQVADASGINRETLRRRLNHEWPFTVAEVALVAMSLGLTPAELIRADEFMRPTD